MLQKDKFAGFDLNHNLYEKEAQERWGGDAISYMSSISAEEKNNLSDEMNKLFAELAGLRHETPESQSVQSAMEQMYHFLNHNFGYQYTLEAFAGLGRMYAEDERFTNNIDQFGIGLAKFLSKAMNVYAKNH